LELSEEWRADGDPLGFHRDESQLVYEYAPRPGRADAEPCRRKNMEETGFFPGAVFIVAISCVDVDRILESRALARKGAMK
jgi:hypothetical protein